jgi:hypothetical protein
LASTAHQAPAFLFKTWEREQAEAEQLTKIVCCAKIKIQKLTFFFLFPGIKPKREELEEQDYCTV